MQSASSLSMIAADIMTRDPVTLPLTDALSSAVDALESLQVRHLPIVDDRGTLVGMLSDRDLGPLVRTFMETAETEELLVQPSDRRIADLMTTAVVSVAPEADVAEVIQLMLDERVGAVPVVDDGEHVIGIISYVDVLRAFVDLAGRVAASAEEEARPTSPG